MEEILDVVDGQNRVIGKESRGVVHKNLLRHRAVHLFVVDEKGLILLGKRSEQKEEYPGCWSFPVSGHIRSGESPDDAIMREMHEETGLRASAKFVKLLQAERKSGNHFSYIYITTVRDPVHTLKLDSREISMLVLWTSGKVRKGIESGARISPIFIGAFRWLSENKRI